MTIGIGSVSLVINVFLKLLPIGKEDHINEESGGIGIKACKGG
jgi:hypothetical protein